jgi:hypothetical protein
MPATAPRERGWRWFVLAMVAVLVVTAAPVWPPALALFATVVRLALPFEQFGLLALAATAACTIVGWWAGGRFLVALIAVALVGWVLWLLPLSAAGYGAFVRGWSLALSAAFGLVCLAARQRPFLGRALAAVALAAAAAAGGLAGGTDSETGVVAKAANMFETDYQRRLDESLSLWRGRTRSSMWQAFADRLPQVAARADSLASKLEGSRTRGGSLLLMLAPALLGLESVLALGLGWASYHRLARMRIGPPLGELRSLRFNDQLVWGLVVGAVVSVLPSLADWRVAGLNLLCFFGSLYALRGVGVLSWWIPDRVAFSVLLGLLVLVPVLGPAPVLMTVVVVALAVGLSDTWRDFRGIGESRRPTSLP